MSMTREEAIEELERLLRHWDDLENDKRCFWGYDQEAVALALSALRPISREQVEKVWRGEWIIVYDEDKEITIATCSKCGDETAYGGSLKADDCDAFCPVCGAPMTDEAVQMVMERLEATT